MYAKMKFKHEYGMLNQLIKNIKVRKQDLLIIKEELHNRIN